MVCALHLKFPSLSTAFKRMQRQLQTNEREKDLLSQCKQRSVKKTKVQNRRQTKTQNTQTRTPAYSWSSVSRLGRTFRLVHVAQHSGPSFIQHVLQKHHLTTTGFHTPHQAEGHVLTPETQENLVYILIKRISAKLAFLTTCLPRSVPKCGEAGKAAQNGSTDFCPS